MSPAAVAQQVYQLLIVDDDSIIRANLREYLHAYHQADYKVHVSEAPTAADAMEMLASHQYDLIICDINLPDQDGFAVLHEASQLQPHIQRALITAYDLDTYIEMAKKHQIYNIIVKTAPFDFAAFSETVTHLLEPARAIGLAPHLLTNTPIETMTVDSSEAIITVHQQLNALLKPYQLPDHDALMVALMEAITNAVYHAQKTPDGELKYTKGQVIEALPPEEQVCIQVGADGHRLGIVVRDPGGQITPDEILYWLERNISGESLFDTHGRGIYLIHRLIDRVIINVQPKQMTELILLHTLDDETPENKPLLINMIPPITH